MNFKVTCLVFIFLIGTLSHVYCNKRDSVKILVIGNSLLAYNHLPSKLDSVLHDYNNNVTIDYLLQNGFSLKDWYRIISSQKKYAENYDIVLLQNNSFANDSIDRYIGLFCRYFNSNKTKYVLVFQNYSIYDFSKNAYYENFEQISKITNKIQLIDKRIIIVTVGKSFFEFYKKHGSTELIMSVDKHPTSLGTHIILGQILETLKRII
jgi:hypothetical protein